MNHHRVDVRARGQKRHERRVLDGVPRPVAAPAELLVRPDHPQRVSDPEEHPGEEGPAATGDDPFGIEPPGHKCGDREGEWHGAADEAGVERRRVDDHPVVLQERVQPFAVRARAGDAGRERVRRERHQHAEEEDDSHQRRDHVRLELEVLLPEREDADADVATEEEEPPQERSVLPAPKRGEQVRERHRAVGVMRHVAEPEVVAHECVREAEDGGGDEGHRPVRPEPGGLQRARAPRCPRGERDCKRVARADHDAEEQRRAEERGRWSDMEGGIGGGLARLCVRYGRGTSGPVPEPQQGLACAA